MPETINRPGGIDFRSLPIVTQAVSNLRKEALLGSVPLGRQKNALAGTDPVDLNAEWQQIERMTSAGITPSSERLKEYIQTSCAQDNIIQDKDKILLCISDILRLEEERSLPTETLLKDILVVLEAGSSAKELREIFLGWLG